MPRKFAFCYAVATGKRPGEVKIGNTSAESLQSAVANVTTRYKSVYGRELVVHKVIPVALPKKDAEDLIKDMYASYHTCGELYTLPTHDATETQRFLDASYAHLKVPMEDAYYVDVPSPADRKAALARQREEVVAREEALVARKRQKIAEREAAAFAAETAAAARAEQKRAAEQAAAAAVEQAKRERMERSVERKGEAHVDGWARERLVRRAGGWVLLKTTVDRLNADSGLNLGKKVVSARLKSLFPGTFAQTKSIEGVRHSGVFCGVQFA